MKLWVRMILKRNSRRPKLSTRTYPWTTRRWIKLHYHKSTKTWPTSKESMTCRMKSNKCSLAMKVRQIYRKQKISGTEIHLMTTHHLLILGIHKRLHYIIRCRPCQEKQNRRSKPLKIKISKRNLIGMRQVLIGYDTIWINIPLILILKHIVKFYS